MGQAWASSCAYANPQVHLVGQSLGANVCMKAAAKQPDRFASLTMLGGVLSGMHMLKNACLQTPRLTVTV